MPTSKAKLKPAYSIQDLSHPLNPYKDQPYYLIKKGSSMYFYLMLSISA